MDGILRPFPGGSVGRCLIVEDDRRVASLHRAVLEAEGIQVVYVAQGFREAWIPKNMVVIGRRAFESLPAQDREALLQAAKRAEERGWRLSQEQEEKALQTLASRGMKVVKPSPTLLADLKKVGQTMILEWQKQAGATGVKVYRQYLGR